MPERIFIWNELVTQDQERAGEFYGHLFGWERKEVDAGSFGTYTLFQEDGKDVAGMMNPLLDRTRDLGTRWYAYVAVDDADRYAARARELGGEIVAGPDDVENVGRIYMLQDPSGGLISIMQPASGEPSEPTHTSS